MMRSLLACILMLSVPALLVGCGQKPQTVLRYDQTVLSGETYTINPPHAVLNSPAMADSSGESTDDWWVSRNDQRLGQRNGAAYRAPGEVFVRTYDRQQSSGDNIHDNYHRAGYGYEYRSVNP